MAGVPALITVLSGSGQSAALNSAFPNYCRVHVQDAQGNPCPNVEVWYECPRGGSQPTGGFGPGRGATQNLFTDTNGNTDGGNTLYAIVNNGSWNLNAYVSGHQGQAGLNVNFALVNGTNIPTSITATSGGGQSTNINTSFGQTLKATVRDGAGLPVPGASVTFTLPTNPVTPIATGTFPGALNTYTGTTDVNGVVNSPTITANGNGGGWTATAKVVSNPALTCSYGMTNTVVLVPTHLTVTAGGGAQSADILTAFPNTVTVFVTDQFGGAVAGTGVDFSTPAQTGASGTLTGHYTTDGTGHATSSTITANNHAGTWYGLIQLTAAPTVQASFGQMTNTTPVTPPVPTSMVITGGGSQTSIPGRAYQPLTVKVLDQFGDGISDTVTISVPSSSNGTFPGGLISTTFTTNSTGVGTSPVLTAGAGLGSFTVTLTGSPGATTTFTNASATAPASQFLNSGNSQFATPSTPYAAPLVTKVVNAVGDPLSGITVTFTAPASSASLTFASTGTNTQTAVTDVNGLATSSTMTANATTGAFNVTSAVSGIANISFSLQNINAVAPTVCSPPVAPVSPANSANPSGGRVWTTPDQVGTATGATVTMSTANNFSVYDNMPLAAVTSGNIKAADIPTSIHAVFQGGCTAPTNRTAIVLLGATFGAQNLAGNAFINNVTGAVGNNTNWDIQIDLTGFSPRPTGADILAGLVVPTLFAQLGTAGTGSGNPVVTVKNMTLGVCYHSPGAWSPEVCTANLSPTGAANVAIGSNPLGAWTNVANLVNPGDPTLADARIVVQGLSTTPSQWALESPQNATQLTVINDAAIITKIGATLRYDTATMGSNPGFINAAIVRSGVISQQNAPQNLASGTTWGTLTIPDTPINPQLTWAEFKAANCGLAVQWGSGTSPFTGTIKIAGLLLKVCYQNPLGATSATGGGQIMCEV